MSEPAEGYSRQKVAPALGNCRKPVLSRLPGRTAASGHVPLTANSTDSLDNNGIFGQVLYTFGSTVDEPLTVVRLNYANADTGMLKPAPYVVFAPMSVTPLWNAVGQWDAAIIPGDPQTFSVGTRNFFTPIQLGWQAYALIPQLPAINWVGSLLQGKVDNVGTMYRRAREYDPQTGRFTQEDPLGLAGGLNAYGFAGGDPVNYDDPFGLCPHDASLAQSVGCALIEIATTVIGADLGMAAGGGAGLMASAPTGGVAAPATVPAGAAAGGMVGAAAGLLIGDAMTDKMFSNSHTVTQTQIGKQNARVDVEYPEGGRDGNVHVQTKGPGGRERYGVGDPNDLSGLPKFLRDNQTIQRGVQKAFDLLNRFVP